MEYKNGKLIGKEIIIIPQDIKSDIQSFVMDWNGQLYTCPMPELTMTENTQCDLDIAAMQTTSHILTGITGNIEDWTSVEGKETDNSGKLQQYILPHYLLPNQMFIKYIVAVNLL